MSLHNTFDHKEAVYREIVGVWVSLTDVHDGGAGRIHGLSAGLVQVRCMSGACQVHVRCMFGACRVHVECMSSACPVQVGCMSGAGKIRLSCTEHAHVTVTAVTVHVKIM